MTPDRLWLLASAIVISLLVAAAVLSARSMGFLQPLELIAYDLGFVALPAPTEPPRVTLIAITERDIARLETWPITDRHLADVIDTLATYSPRTIGIDIYRDIPVPPGRDALDAAFARHENVIGIFKFDTEGDEGVAPPPTLAASARIGFSDIVLDPGGIARRGLAFLDDGETVGTAFALRLALAWLRPEGIDLVPDVVDPTHFRLGDVTFTPIGTHFGGYHDIDAGGYQFLIDFTRRPETFPRFALSDLTRGVIPREALHDRIVLLGVDAESVKDSFGTPLGQWPWARTPEIPGIALHAVLTDQFLRAALHGDRPMSAWSTGAEWIGIFATCILGGLAGLLSRSARRLLALVSAGTVVLAGFAFAAFAAGVWMPLVPMLIGWLGTVAFVTAYLVQRERRERDLLKQIFSLQVSADVADAMWARRRELLAEGELRSQNVVATVMFVDLKGFTGMSETLPSDVLLAWLKPFMELATRTIFEYGGMVDDYFGDGLKANFGIPISRSREEDIDLDAVHAIECALALVERSQALGTNSERPYRLRIGIHTGTIVAGSVGSAQRMKYTSIGDTVNVAARLEAHAKDIAPSSDETDCILISAATARRTAGRFRTVSLGQVSLKGRLEPIGVHRVYHAPANQGPHDASNGGAACD